MDENKSLKTLQAPECLTLWLNFYFFVHFVFVYSSFDIASTFKTHCVLFILSFIVFYIQCELHRLFQFLFIVKLLPKRTKKKNRKQISPFMCCWCGFFQPFMWLWGRSPDSLFSQKSYWRWNRIEESNENSSKLRPNNNTFCIQFTKLARTFLRRIGN